MTVVLLALLGAVRRRHGRDASRGSGTDSLRAPELSVYGKQPSLLSPAERSFFGVLQPLAAELGMYVSCKTRLADVVFVHGNPSGRQALLNRTSQKHVDFLLCEQATMEPILAIELDDGSHARPDRQHRDELVDAIFSAVALPLLHARAQRGYVVADVRSQIVSLIKHPTAAENAAA
jgi:Protein of unknown function (DUF2726)